MLKTAYEMGVKLAFDEYGITPEQLAAAQRLTGVGGGAIGSGLGSLLGSYLGGRASDTFDLDEDRSRLVGGGLGALIGGGVGGYAGSQLPKWKYPVKKEEQENGMGSSLGVLPSAYGYDGYGSQGDYASDYYDDPSPASADAYGLTNYYGY